MDHEQIFEAWKADCAIDRTALDEASLDIPKLHGKWLRILSDERAVLRGLERHAKKYRHAMRQFFIEGPKDAEHAKKAKEELNWILPPKGKILKTEINDFVDNHPEMIKKADEVAHQVEKVDVLSEIIKQINKRNYLIRDAIDDRRFKQGST